MQLKATTFAYWIVDFNISGHLRIKYRDYEEMKESILWWLIPFYPIWRTDTLLCSVKYGHAIWTLDQAMRVNWRELKHQWDSEKYEMCRTAGSMIWWVLSYTTKLLMVQMFRKNKSRNLKPCRMYNLHNLTESGITLRDKIKIPLSSQALIRDHQHATWLRWTIKWWEIHAPQIDLNKLCKRSKLWQLNKSCQILHVNLQRMFLRSAALVLLLPENRIRDIGTKSSPYIRWNSQFSEVASTRFWSSKSHWASIPTQTTRTLS